MESSLDMQTQNEAKKLLIQSMLTMVWSRIKLMLRNPMKNIQFARTDQLLNLVDLLGEQMIPQFCKKNFSNLQSLNKMHDLCFLLSLKVQQVFNSNIIRTIIDQNWDLKGMKAVILRMLSLLEIEEYNSKVTQLFDKLIQSQNLQSQSCIRAITMFIKNKNKKIDPDDLNNPISTYQTTFEFLKADIEQYRQQQTKIECFQVLHPWAYDLDLVDFKYILNKNQVENILQLTKDNYVRLFWLSFFKQQLGCCGDEFFNAIREMCEMMRVDLNSGSRQYFDQEMKIKIENLLVKNDFVISLRSQAEEIQQLVAETVNISKKYRIHFNQIKTRTDDNYNLDIIQIPNIQGNFGSFFQNKEFEELQEIQTCQVEQEEIGQMNFYKKYYQICPLQASRQTIKFKFLNVDTEELKETVINYSGEMAQYKLGEGDNNHYQICNDKKLWESQFMIVQKNGQFYIRDLGIVHTSRIKVDQQLQIQIQQGSLVDLGKVVHYHFDKVTHLQQPIETISQDFLIFRQYQSYLIDEDNQPVLRARPTWVSQDENREMIQNEILIEFDKQRPVSQVGRSVKRDVEIKLKAVSSEHCQIYYEQQKGWVITEKQNQKKSSNGTYVFMKSFQQIDNNEPSDMIRLYNGMIISFINYEILVEIQDKNESEIYKQEQEIQYFYQQRDKELEDKFDKHKRTFKAKDAQNIVQEDENQLPGQSHQDQQMQDEGELKKEKKQEEKKEEVKQEQIQQQDKQEDDQIMKDENILQQEKQDLTPNQLVQDQQQVVKEEIKNEQDNININQNEQQNQVVNQDIKQDFTKNVKQENTEKQNQELELQEKEEQKDVNLENIQQNNQQELIQENVQNENLKLAEEKKEQERIEQERKEQERIEQERKEQERIEQERKEQEKKEQEKIEQEKIEQKRIEQERKEQERKEQEKKEQEFKEQEKIEQEKKEQELKQQEDYQSELQNKNLKEEVKQEMNIQDQQQEEDKDIQEKSNQKLEEDQKELENQQNIINNEIQKDNQQEEKEQEQSQIKLEEEQSQIKLEEEQKLLKEQQEQQIDNVEEKKEQQMQNMEEQKEFVQDQSDVKNDQFGENDQNQNKKEEDQKLQDDQLKESDSKNENEQSQ